jgi:hypothetical protein
VSQIIQFPPTSTNLEIDEDIGYFPQPKQQLLHKCPANEILYGGAAGPGKSHALRYEALLWAQRIKGLQVYLFRRIHPELERNHILRVLVDWGNKYGVYREQKRRYELPNGSMIHFCHAQYEKDVMIYHGAEIHLLLIDELTTFTEFQYTYLRNRVRTTLDIPPQYRHKIPGIACATNPGGVGHEYCKRIFVDFCLLDSQQTELDKAEGMPVYEHHSKRTEGTISYGLVQAEDKDGGMLRAYIPGLLEDNQILMRQDPGYINRVRAMPEPYRSAYLEGDWEIFIGQMFSFNQRDHVCKPMAIPKNAPVYMTFDWGFGKPFSVGWWWVDADNRVFRFAEWYGWNGQPDHGMRLTDSQIAEGIIEREFKLGLRDPETGMEREMIYRLAGPDCFSKKPDYKGGGQGKSTAEVFSEPRIVHELMCEGIILSPGDPSRELKVRQFHERLRVKDGEMPMMLIYDSCKHFIRTIPLLQQDELKPEDVDTKMEDHVYDEACHILMNRPLSLEYPSPRTTAYQRRIDQLKRGRVNSYEYVATMEQQHEMNRLTGHDYSDPHGHMDADFDEYDDGAMIDTI